VVEEEVLLGYFFLPVVLGTALGAGLAVLQVGVLARRPLDAGELLPGP